MNLAGITRHESVAVDAGRWAAVITPVAFRGERPHILFTKRADHLDEHPGQMNFPDGGREPSDADLRVTAFCKSNEETGLRSEEAVSHGCPDDIWTVIDYAVSSFVATVPDRAYEPGQREVAEIMVFVVGDLIDRANYELGRRDRPQYGGIRLHFFHVDSYTVRGATGQTLMQLLELAIDWHVPGEIDHVVDPDADYPM